MKVALKTTLVPLKANAHFCSEMAESDSTAASQKKQQPFQQQQHGAAMPSMGWQYPAPSTMHMFPTYASQMYTSGYQGVPSQNQMFNYYHAMMPGYGQAFSPQQMQQHQHQQPQHSTGQTKQLHSQPPVPGTPMSLGEDSDLPPLPPGPPPSIQSMPQQKNQVQPLMQQPLQQNTGYMYNSFPYGNWNVVHNDVSQYNSPVAFNVPNKKTGSPFPTSGNSGAAKKKRKRNKNLAAQFGNAFQGSNTTNFIPGPNLKAELPPLPPTQREVLAPPPPVEESPDISLPNTTASNTTSSVTVAVGTSSIMTNPSPVRDWPDSLKNYVNRCYEKCKTAVDKDQVEIILKGKITRAANDGSLWVKDWDKEPLPSIHSERMTMTIKPQKQVLKLNNPLMNSHANVQAGLRKPGLSISLGARLGARLSKNHKRSRSRSRSSSRSKSISRSKSRSRSRSRSGSRSRTKSRSRSKTRTPPSRRHRRSTSSSSNHSDREHDYKALKVKRSTKNKQNHSSKKVKKMKQPKSLFYSEFGLGSGNTDELGSKEKLQQRAARFCDGISRTVTNGASYDASDFDFTGLHIVGTCKDIEKPYLRLTSAPAASAVRPVNVLQNSLAHVKKRWIADQDYRYTCDQLKSIRQDLTVQGIRDSFTVHVYETHARVALERGDHEEFNQCQTQLKMLYQEVGGQNRCEFVAYRILYYIFTKNTQDLTTILAALTHEDKKDECVTHALKVRSAWWLGNFHAFFKLYRMAPRMAGFLINWFVSRERKIALKNMIKSYRQNLAVDFVVAELAFESLDKFYEFVNEFGLVYADPEQHLIDCKTSSGSLGAW